MGGLGNHTNLIRPIIERLQLLVGKKIQFTQAPDCPLNRHQISSLTAQHQKRNQYNGDSHGSAQHTYQNAHSRHCGINFCSVIPNHKNPSAVFQVFIDHQLPSPVLISVRICTGLGTAIRLNTLKDLLISCVGGFGIQ